MVMNLNDLKASILDNAHGSKIERSMLEDLIDAKLTPLQKECARNITVPIAAFLSRGSVNDTAIREAVTTMTIRHMALAFAYHMEREIKPEHLDVFATAIASQFYVNILDAISNLAELRAKGQTKEFE